MVIQKMLGFLKRSDLVVPEMREDDDIDIGPCERPVPDHAPDESAPSNHEETWPSAQAVGRCKRLVSHFVWSVPPGLVLYWIHGTELSRAASNYAWHFSPENFVAMKDYFDGLEWSAQSKVSFLKLCVD